jgi:hypothetical protein
VEQPARAAVSSQLLAGTVQTVTGGAILTTAPHVGLLASRVIRSMLIAELRIAAAIVMVAAALAGAAWFGASAPGGTARAQDDRPVTPLPAKNDPVVPKEVAQFKGATRSAMTADGTVLATAHYADAITLWDLTCDRELGKLKMKEGDVRALAFSPDGKTLAGGGIDDVIHLWDVPGRELLAVFKEKTAPDSHVLSLAFSPDGKTLAAGNELETIKLFDVAARKQKATLPFKESDVRALAYSPDGKTLAAGGDDKGGTVLLFDVEDRKEVARLAGHKEAVSALAFTRDGKTLVTGSRDKTIRVWDVDLRKVRATLEGHTHHVTCLAVARDGKTIISGGRDRTVRLWDVATGKETTVPLTFDGMVNSVSLSADGSKFATAAADRKVRLWELTPNAAVQKAPAIPAAIQVPEGYVHLLTAEADGVQMYVSEATKDGFKWTFRAPLADLKVMGAVAGYHYAGPTWELKGGCKVVRDDSEAVRSADSPDGKGNIPWLLIKLKADDTNTGRLAGAVYVQRVNTQGGSAPTEMPKRAETEVGVKYRATYHFFRKK